MIKRFLSVRLPFKKKLKNFVSYITRIRGAGRAWRKRHSFVFGKHPEYKKSAGEAKERKHQNYWSEFSFNFSPDTFRICEVISGDADPGRHTGRDLSG